MASQRDGKNRAAIQLFNYISRLPVTVVKSSNEINNELIIFGMLILLGVGDELL